MEAHEGIFLGIVRRRFDIRFVEIAGDGVVDVKQGDGVAAGTHADVFADGAVNVDFAGDRDAAGYETAVDVARFKAELGREGRPAFIGKSYILTRAFVRFSPVEESQFVLCHAGQEVRPGVSVFAEFFRHIGDDVGNARIVFVSLIRYEKVEFGVFFDFNA